MRLRLAFLLSVLLALLIGRESAAWHVGPARVTDGDTVNIGADHFRLKGVRAPESRTNAGQSATQFLRDHVIGTRWVACRTTGHLTFSRYEAFCFALPGTDIGAAVIRAGQACAATQARYRVADYVVLAASGPNRPPDCGN